MSNATNHRRTLIRKFIAVAVLCLFVLRGMGFMGMISALAAPHTDGLAFTHAMFEDQCARQDGSNSPKKDAHPEHCMLCCSQARDIFALSAFIFVSFFLVTPNQPVASEPPFEKNLHSLKAAGLIANWSATSPPQASQI